MLSTTSLFLAALVAWLCSRLKYLNKCQMDCPEILSLYNIHDPQRMNPSDFDDPQILIFYLTSKILFYLNKDCC